MRERVEGGPSDGGWTYVLVEERLIEAAAAWRRAADRTAGWHHVKAFWPQGRPDYDWWFDYDARGGEGRSSDVRLKPLPLSRAETGRMTEASEWIGRHVAERDRRLVHLVVQAKASGRRVDWIDMARLFERVGPDGMFRAPDALRMRYSRAVASIVRALDRGGVRVDMARI